MPGKARWEDVLHFPQRLVILFCIIAVRRGCGVPVRRLCAQRALCRFCGRIGGVQETQGFRSGPLRDASWGCGFNMQEGERTALSR